MDDAPDRHTGYYESGRRAGGLPSTVRVLASDSDLGGRLSAPDFAAASKVCVARVLCLRRGAVGGWPLRAEPEAGFQGFLVLSGFLSCRAAMGALHAAELLGPGDLLRPWPLEDQGMLNQTVHWRVQDRAVLAVLDRGFHRRAASWPELYSTLRDRDTERMQSLVTRLLIAQTPRISERVNLLLWHLAGRWGTVGPDGVSLPLHLSKALIAELVCTTRESVSRAMTVLGLRGLVESTERGFLLHDVRPPVPEVFPPEGGDSRALELTA